jgi:hypothetical protein
MLWTMSGRDYAAEIAAVVERVPPSERAKLAREMRAYAARAQGLRSLEQVQRACACTAAALEALLVGGDPRSAVAEFV